ALLRPVVDAVAALHAGGIVHGDLKPSNVLVDRRGRPVVVDFGLAMRGGGSRGRAFGTPGYAAPEQLDRDGRAVPASDVFALGAMLYLLLTGERPIPDSTVDACRARALAVDYRLPQERAPETPAKLQRICLAALEPELARRYRDAAAMLADLDRWRRGEEVTARPAILQARFFDQVDTTLAHVERWRLQSLVTDAEAEALADRLQRVRRPDTHWLVDARRLVPSQVALYFGGWMSLTALTAGLWFAWESFESTPWMRWLVPAATALVLAIAALVLQARRETRIALGFFIVVDLAIAVSTLQLLRETGWLAPAVDGPVDVPVRDRVVTNASDQLVALLDRSRSPTLGEWMGGWNEQLLVVAAAWLIGSIALRRVTGAAALTPMASLAALLFWTSAFASAGFFRARDEHSMLLLGGWLVLGGAIALAMGIRGNSREERREQDAGEGLSPPRDAWSMASIGVASILGGLLVAAWYGADLITLGLLDDFRDSTRRAAAFIAAAIPVIALALLLQRRRTPLRIRLANFVRIVAPTWVLFPLLVIERDAGSPWWMLWQIVFFACVIAVAAMSAVHNWKPFFLSSLVYFVAGYASLTVRLTREIDGPTGSVARVVMFAALVAGISTMIAAYAVPRLRAARSWRGARDARPASGIDRTAATIRDR
ncbi:MAG: serine/threonine protein kinase, partial [Phycisphaerae bacterium]|nr:serine/threonine protein kinase [Phycisphaerae bacterium]